MRRDDQRLDWADVSADLIVVADDDPVLAAVPAALSATPAAGPLPAWDVRDPPSRLWTSQAVATIYRWHLQDLARQLAAHRQRRTPHA
ncbi:MAG: hypothetical protein IT179_13485 [Acidobacteria bacterium]|nr:hypothetical protein [Acidobacteriota bacterium]